MTLSDYRKAFPEHAQTVSDDMLTQWLALAATRVDAGAYGSSYDLAHGLLTAHYIANSPGGKNARMVSNNAKSTYKTSFDELRHAAGAGLGRVI